MALDRMNKGTLSIDVLLVVLYRRGSPVEGTRAFVDGWGASKGGFRCQYTPTINNYYLWGGNESPLNGWMHVYSCTI